MTLKDTRTSRRSFFLKGSAALGAGVAATAGAAMLPGREDSADTDLKRQLAMAADREAIRQLHLLFTALVENHGFHSTGNLFNENAQVDLGGTGVILRAYRPNALQRLDSLHFSADGRQATAAWHVDVAVEIPLPADCTAAQMARLQGQSADRHWESGRIEAEYGRSRGEWKISALRYTPMTSGA